MLASADGPLLQAASRLRRRRCPSGSVDDSSKYVKIGHGRVRRFVRVYMTCPAFSNQGQKWLLPRHFRRQAARRCTRRYSSRVCEVRCPTITHRRRSSLSKTREATLVCARGRLYAAGKPGAHALAASTAAPRAGLTYASSLTRPSLSPMSAKNLRLRRRRHPDR